MNEIFKEWNTFLSSLITFKHINPFILYNNFAQLRHTSYNIENHLWTQFSRNPFFLTFLSLTTTYRRGRHIWKLHQKWAFFFPHALCSFTLSMCHFVSYSPSFYPICLHSDNLPLPHIGNFPSLFHKPTFYSTVYNCMKLFMTYLSGL